MAARPWEGAPCPARVPWLPCCSTHTCSVTTRGTPGAPRRQAGRRPPRGSGAAGAAWVAAASAARPRARVWVPVFQRLPEDRERAGRSHGSSCLRSSPGSALAVLRLPAGARTAVRQLQSVSDGPVRAAAAALRLRAGKAPGCPLGPATWFLCGHEERGGWTSWLLGSLPASVL